MGTVVMNKNDDIIMRLVHYFITECDYSPVVVNGIKDEIWLENNEGPYKIIRINSNHIHNNEQLRIDMYKTFNIMKQIKKQTFSLSMNVLNIFLDLGESVTLKETKNIYSIKLKTLKDLDNSFIEKSFPNIKDKMLVNLEGIDLIINVTKDINQKTEKRNKSYERTFKPKKIVITNILIGVCVMMFLLTLIYGKGVITSEILYYFGANFAPAIRDNFLNIYRFLTSTFLHVSILHLLCNMYALFILGTQVETFLGKKKFILIYLISGITGSLLSFVFTNALSVGASGAIFGLMGSLLYFGYHYRLYIGSAIKNQIVPIIILNLLLGFTFSNIDNAAHIGGLVGGYLSTMLVGVNEKATKSEKVNALIVLVILWGFLFYVGMYLR